MKPQLKRGKRIGASVALAAVIGGLLLGGLGWRAWDTRRTVAEGIPAQPDLARSPAGLRERIDDAERRARSWRTATKGLAELGRLYHANGFLTPARDAYRGLARVDPDNPRWPHLLANILAGYGELDAAVPLLRRTVALAPVYLPARLRLGDALLKINRSREAAEAYAAVLQREPGNPYALLGLARHQNETGNANAARERLQQAVKAQPDFAAGWALLATVEAQLGNASGAETARAGEQNSGSPRDLPDPWLDELPSDCYDVYRLRVAAASAPDNSIAKRWLERAIQVAPGDAGPRRQLGDLLTKQGDYQVAREHLQRAVEIAPKEADNWAYLLRLFDLAGDSPSGDRALVAGLAHCPLSPSLHLERGRRLKRAGQLEPALAAFETSRRLRPQEIDAYVEMSGIYFRLNRIEEGIAVLRSALAVEPAHPVVLSTLAFCTIGSGDETNARQALRDARAQPRVPRADLDQLVRRFGERFGRSPW